MPGFAENPGTLQEPDFVRIVSDVAAYKVIDFVLVPVPCPVDGTSDVLNATL